MRPKVLKWEVIILCVILFFSGISLNAQEVRQNDIYEIRQSSFSRYGFDTLSVHTPHRFIHRLGVEVRPQYVFPTNPFLQGENERWQPIQTSFAAHLKYSFQFRPNTCADRIYGGAYQGFGLSATTFGDKKQLGDPISFYVFQGARIARFNPCLSLNYEWNFGLSAGWKPYDNDYNSYNGAVGSRMNAYINAGIYLNWAFSRYFDLIIGGDFTHFSNGNTKFPNAGVNTTGAKIGLVYNFNRTEEELTKIPKGNFVDPEGNVLGQHKGIIYYTVGQRRGLGLSLKKPGYVIKVDKDTNEVVVGDKQDLFANVLYGNKVNCMSVPAFEDGMRLMAKIRYNSSEVPCRVYMTGEDEVRVVFDDPQRAITPGQAVVFYDGDIVAGGATILRAANE